jgi:hypothetical protein
MAPAQRARIDHYMSPSPHYQEHHRKYLSTNLLVMDFQLHRTLPAFTQPRAISLSLSLPLH